MENITIDSVSPCHCPSGNYNCLSCEHGKGLFFDNTAESSVELKVRCGYEDNMREEEAVTVGEYASEMR